MKACGCVYYKEVKIIIFIIYNIYYNYYKELKMSRSFIPVCSCTTKGGGRGRGGAESCLYIRWLHFTACRTVSGF